MEPATTSRDIIPETTRGAGERAPVAVVIVTWNAEDWLAGCLDSLARLERRPEQIVVVDNASRDASARIAAARAPETTLVRLERNEGFCRANNLGIARTASPFVLVLNPDTRLAPDFLERLLPAFDDRGVGIATGKLLRFDEATIDSAGQRLGRSRQPKDRGYGRRDRGQYERDEEVFGACGAAALYRRAMLDDVADPGGAFFDEAFFAFVEDLDLAWRARRRGWRALYCHRAVAFHARSGTASGPLWKRRLAAMLGRSPEIRFHVAKNRYLTILRNDRGVDYLLHAPFIWARDLATLALLLATSPGVLVRLWSARHLFRAALAKRRLDGSRPRHQVG